MSETPGPPPDPAPPDGEAPLEGAAAAEARVREAPTDDAAIIAAQRLRDAPTEAHLAQALKASKPIEQVRSDVSSIANFFSGIHSRYVWAGIIGFLLTAGVGTVVALTVPLSDWFMHAFMYLIAFVFLLFYVRAHQLRRRFARGFYAIATTALFAFFAWVLLDLIDPRPDVVTGEIVRPDGETVTGPTVVTRPAAGGLVAPAVMLLLMSAWLLFHWLVVTRFQRRTAAS